MPHRSVALAAVLWFLTPAAAPAAGVAWLGIGGGADPGTTQVSLEQDLALAREVFGADGRILFAGGNDAFGVQVQRDDPAEEGLLHTLGDILDPRDGRQARYRKPALATDGPATPESIERELAAALAAGDEPLLLYVATHGEIGDSPADNTIVVWGGFTLSARRLAELLEATPSSRPVRLVLTSCYSGGFADLAFAGADPERGATSQDRCGFFTSTEADVASGCDPNPDRRRQDGYGLTFLHALRLQQRDGSPLPRPEVDFDGDGKVSLLEAHTRARIVSASFDVPTTTSERWLRHATQTLAVDEVKEAGNVVLPEESAVIAAVGASLRLADAAAASARRDALQAQFEAATAALEEANAAVDEAAADTRIALLERWPMLDDPWHPDFAATLLVHRQAIAEALRSGPAEEYRRRLAAAEEHGVRYDTLKVELARVQVLARAHETIALADRLRRAGGEAWKHYERLLACERGLPPRPTP